VEPKIGCRVAIDPMGLPNPIGETGVIGTAGAIRAGAVGMTGEM
jgi:hypothetical protein